jgi:YbbR domain-containing protein
MDLTISGGRRQLATLSRDNMRVTVSLDGVDEAGIQSVAYSSITSSNRRFSQGMIVMRTPNVVTVNIKELNRKTVDIRCDLVGNLAEGYNAGELVLSQTSVELQGQAEDINSVSYAKVTLDIGNQAEESITRDLELQYYDANHQLVTSTNIRSLVETVQVTLPVFVTKELPLVVEFKEAAGLSTSNLEYEISPATIVVSGDASKLKGVKNIVLGEFDLADMLNNNASSHTYPIIIPEGCQNLSGVTRATMNVAFKDMARAQVETAQFQFLNAPSGKHVDVLTQALNVTVYGTSEAVAGTREEHLTIQVDLENYAAASGTYTVPVKVVETAPGDIGVDGTYHVQVTIHEAGEADPDEHPETANSAE